MPCRTLSRCLVAVLTVLLIAGGAAAVPFDLFLESRQNESSGSEIFHTGFPSIEDLKANTNPSGSFSVFDVGAAFDIAGVASDGQSYHIFLESQQNEVAGQEIFHAQFASLDDFLTGGILTAVQRGFTQFDVGAAFDLVGVAQEGDAFHVFLESQDDRSSGQEFFHARFASLDDLLDGNILSANPRGFSVFDIGAAFDVAGVAHDGESFRILLESQDDRQAGDELFHVEFTSLDDLLVGGVLASPDRGFTQINVNPAYDVVGFAAAPVPEPVALLLLSSGLAGLALAGRRRA